MTAGKEGAVGEYVIWRVEVRRHYPDAIRP